MDLNEIGWEGMYLIHLDQVTHLVSVVMNFHNSKKTVNFWPPEWLPVSQGFCSMEWLWTKYWWSCYLLLIVVSWVKPPCNQVGNYKYTGESAASIFREEYGRWLPTFGRNLLSSHLLRRWMQQDSPKHWYTTTRLYGIITQNTTHNMNLHHHENLKFYIAP